MFDERLFRELEQFKKRWQPYLALSPHFSLDGSWSSVAAIDLLTFGLRFANPAAAAGSGNANGNAVNVAANGHAGRHAANASASLLRGASLYLAAIIHDCWKELGAEVEVGEGADGIAVTAHGGKFLGEGQTAVAPVEAEFKRCLSELPFPFPLTTDSQRPISFTDNIVSPFAVCLCTGLHPSVSGPWPTMDVNKFAPAIDAVVKRLAASAADRYTRLYPDEPVGQMPEIYLNGLIFPPLYSVEALPGQNGVHKLLDYAEDIGFEAASAASLLRPFLVNLCASPDDQMSTVGIALYAAISDEPPPLPVFAAARTRGRSMGLLRAAMKSARSRLGLGEDWLDTGLSDDAACARYRLEKDYGFIPWLTLSAETVQSERENSRLKDLLIALSVFDLAASLEHAETLVAEQPKIIEWHVQLLKLVLEKGDFEQAEHIYRRTLSEPDSDESPELFNLWGLAVLGRKSPEEAVKHFRAALALPAASGQFRADLHNNLGWALLCKGDLEGAAEQFEQGLAHAAYPVTLLLNKMTILWRMHRYEEVNVIKRKLFALAPSDRRVFASIGLEAPREEVRRAA